jgi:hypothetical protein
MHSYFATTKSRPPCCQTNENEHSNLRSLEQKQLAWQQMTEYFTKKSSPEEQFHEIMVVLSTYLFYIWTTYK